MLAIAFADVVHTAHVWMGYLACESNFLMKSRQTIGVLTELNRQELECDRLSELQILGAVDLTHATTTQESDNAIAARE